MEDNQHGFTKSLGYALSFVSVMIVILGSLSYAAYGQYTEGVILLNLKPDTWTYMV